MCVFLKKRIEVPSTSAPAARCRPQTFHHTERFLRGPVEFLERSAAGFDNIADLRGANDGRQMGRRQRTNADGHAVLYLVCQKKWFSSWFVKGTEQHGGKLLPCGRHAPKSSHVRMSSSAKQETCGPHRDESAETQAAMALLHALCPPVTHSFRGSSSPR